MDDQKVGVKVAATVVLMVWLMFVLRAALRVGKREWWMELK